MIGLRGLGSTDVGPLAAAFFSGDVNPTFLPTQYFDPSYMAAGETSALPSDLYMDAASASAIASLLGGSVYQAPPPGGYNGTNIPPANWIQVTDGAFDPGLLFPPGVVQSYPDVCAAEQAFASEIPGGVVSAACASGGSGLTPTQLALQNGSLSPNQQQAAASDIVAGSVPPLVTPSANPVPATPVSTVPAGTSIIDYPILTAAPTQSSGSQVIAANPTPAPGSTPAVNPPAAGATSVAVAAASCFNPISSWLSMDTCLGPLGIVEWAIVAAIALYAFSAGGKR